MRIGYINQDQIQTGKQELSAGEKKNVTAAAESMAGALSGVLFGTMEAVGQKFPGYGKNGGTDEKMTAGELKAQMGVTDSSLQLKYMTVMSNSVSDEEYGRMLEDGFDPSNVEVETAVTILDHIKAAVVAGGTEVIGYTDTLSEEQLKDILGSAELADSLSTGLCKKDIEYMLRNMLDPTPENIFLTKNSSGGTDAERLANTTTQVTLAQELQEDPAFLRQMESVIKEAGLEITEESKRDAFMLLSMELPLTKENIERLETLKEFRRPLPEEEIKHRIALQAEQGTKPAEADLSKTESIYETAVRVAEETKQLTDEHADAVVLSGKALTLRSLFSVAHTGATPAESKLISADSDVSAENSLQTSNKEMISARRLLEEIRLSMTVDANLRLLRKGISLETAPLVELVDSLKQAEKELQTMGVTDMFRVQEQIDSLRRQPAETLSYAVSGEISFTVSALNEKGSALRDSLQVGASKETPAIYKLDKKLTEMSEVQAKYETSGTQIRTDLGDSLSKARRNTDALLQELGMDVTDENRRAVAILSSKSMELSEENMQKARELDDKLQTLFEDMKPARILQLVKEGIDILHTDIEELDRYLQTMPVPLSGEKEDYARFLQKMQRQGAISKEEREGFIQVVRLIRRTQKADGRAEGFLLGTEAAPTLEHLLTALNSSRKKHMDVKADDSFGGMDGELYRSIAFLQQFKQPVTLNNREQAAAVLDDSSALYERFAAMESKLLSGVAAAETAVLSEETEAFAETNEVNAGIGKEYRVEKLRGKKASAFTDLVRELQSALDREETLQSAWDSFAEKAEELLSLLREAPAATGLDLMSLRQLSKGLEFGRALAKESCYQIPLETEDGYTVVHLTLKKGDGNPTAEVSMQAGEFGLLQAFFEKTAEKKPDDLSQRSLFSDKYDVTLAYGGNGYVKAESTAGYHLAERIAAELSENSGNEVYETAKLFIDIVRKAI